MSLNLIADIDAFRGSIYTYINYKCGPMPNVMAALPNIGNALCSMPQGLADAHSQSPECCAVTLPRRENR